MSVEQNLLIAVFCIAVIAFMNSTLRILVGGRQQQRQ